MADLPAPSCEKKAGQRAGILRLEGFQSLRGHPGTRFGTGSTPCTACLKWHPCCRPWQGTAGTPTALTSTPCPEWPPQGIFLVLGHENYTESPSAQLKYAGSHHIRVGKTACIHCNGDLTEYYNHGYRGRRGRCDVCKIDFPLE